MRGVPREALVKYRTSANRRNDISFSSWMSAKAEISSCILNISEMESGRRELDVEKTVLRTGGVVGKPALSSFMWHGDDADFPGSKLGDVECSQA